VRRKGAKKQEMIIQNLLQETKKDLLEANSKVWLEHQNMLCKMRHGREGGRGEREREREKERKRVTSGKKDRKQMNLSLWQVYSTKEAARRLK
jgi:hypothetical protein